MHGGTSRRAPCHRAQASQKPSPWHLGYQLNERYLEWGTAPQTQLIKMFCAKELDIDVSEVCN